MYNPAFQISPITQGSHGEQQVVSEEYRLSHNSNYEEEMSMAKNFKLKLTADQQKQIKNATGKAVSELNIEIAAGGQLTDADLDEFVGGKGKKSSGGTTTPPPK